MSLRLVADRQLIFQLESSQHREGVTSHYGIIYSYFTNYADSYDEINQRLMYYRILGIRKSENSSEKMEAEYCLSPILLLPYCLLLLSRVDSTQQFSIWQGIHLP